MISQKLQTGGGAFVRLGGAHSPEGGRGGADHGKADKCEEIQKQTNKSGSLIIQERMNQIGTQSEKRKNGLDGEKIS